MIENEYDSLPDLNRRAFLKGTLASAFVGTGLSVGTRLVAGQENATVVVEQGGDSYEIEPLTHEGATIEEFYGYQNGSAHTATGLETDATSELFLWNGPEGLSLVGLHGNGSQAGEVEFSLSGLPEESSSNVFADDFESGIGAWQTDTWGGYNGDVIADDGRMRLRVYRCHNAEATRSLGTHSGTLQISFDWEATADQWYEIPDWGLETADGEEIPYTVVSGQDVESPGYRGHKSGSVTVEAEVDGPVRLRFAVEQSGHCRNFDHADTYLWVDDVTVQNVTGTGGEWVVRDDPADFASPADPTPKWSWSAGETDGGAFRGGLQEAGSVTIDPNFVSGIDRWHLLTPQSVQERAFDLHNRYSSSTRTRGWEKVELDLSAFAGQAVTITLQADGRHTYDYQNTVSWIKADYVRIDGVLDETFEDLSGWECTNQPRGGGHDDTPTEGFCRAQDGYAYVQEETNRTRFLSRTVQLPASGDLVLRARVKGHVSASWSHARLVVEGDAGANDPERIGLDTDDPVTIQFESGEDEPATVTDVTLPPTAVETGEEPTFDVTVDPGTYSPDELAVEASADLTRRGEDVASASASVTATETDDGQVRFQGSMPSASSLASRPEGVGFETTIRVLADETAVEVFESVRTFAFRQIDRVGAIAAHASDTTPSRNGRDLFEFVRRRAEFVNEHYASGLGNMGAKGFAVELLNERDAETDPFAVEWLELPKQVSEYETRRPRNLPDENVRDFVRTSLEAFNPSGGANVADYDTAMVVNPQALSRPNWQGSIPPTAHFEIPEIDFEIRTPTEVPMVGIAPYDLADGEQIDAIYATVDDDAWSHEFGHAMGPGLQVGFPEMYKMDSLNNFGNIGNWGVMGGGTHNDVVSAFVRGFVSDQPYGIEKWIDWDVDLHVKDDVTMDLDTPLSQFELGDAAQLLLSAYFEFAIEIEIDYPDLGDLDPGIDVSVKEADPQFGIYVLENREGRASGIVDPAHDELVTAPPTTRNGSDYQEGVALYRFDILHFDEFGVDLSDVLNPDVNVEIGTDSLQLDFLPEDPTADPATERHPTNISLSSGHTTYEDRVSASTFELSKTRDQGGPEVTVKREIEDLIDVNGELISDAVTLVVGLLDEFEDRLRDAFSGATSGGPRIPKLDVYAETPDGRRAGTDPETGEVIEEIDGARVVQTMSQTRVSVPASADVTFEVSDARLRSALESDGVEVPDTVAYERSVIVDNDPEIVERDGAAHIEGRTVQRGPAAVGDDGRPALQTVPVDVDPAKINARSNGEFVTGFLGVGSHDPEKLRLETVALEQVPAVADRKHGFVKNPPTETRDGDSFVVIKFPRDRVVERLGTGTHDVKITGLVEDVTVYGTTEVTIFEPGDGNGSGNSGSGNGNAGSGNGNGN